MAKRGNDNRGKGKQKDYFNDVRCAGRTNDGADWYLKIPAAASASTGLPEFTRLGVLTATGALTNNYPSAIPTVMVLYYLNTLGPQYGGQNGLHPINTSFSAFRSYLTSKNSRFSQLEAGDLGQWMLCATDFDCMLQILRRALQAYKTYHVTRPEIGKMLVTALGFNYSIIDNNYAQLVTYYNSLVARRNTELTIPKDWAYYQRKMMMAGNIIADSASELSQIYVTMPLFFWKYDEANAQCTNIRLHSLYTSSTIESIKLKFDSALDALLNTAVAQNYIVSDMRAAMDASSYVVMPFLEMGEYLEIYADDHVNEQIMNTELLPVFTRHVAEIQDVFAPDTTSRKWNVIDSSVYVRQDSSGFLYQGDASASIFTQYGPVVKLNDDSTTNAAYGSWIDSEVKYLNFYKDHPSEVDLFVATRNMCRWHAYKHDANYQWINTYVCGTEVFTHGLIIKNYDQLDGTQSTNVPTGLAVENFTLYLGFGSSPTINSQTVKRLSLIGSFNWRPKCFICDVTYGTYLDAIGQYRPMHELEKVITLSGSNLLSIHETAVTSLNYLQSLKLSNAGFVNSRADNTESNRPERKTKS